MDNYGLKKSSEFINQGRVYFYSPEGKDPYDTYQRYGKVKLIAVAKNRL